MTGPIHLPQQDLETLATWGTEHLTRIIAIDSQSDEASDAIPSTEGQRAMAADLQRFFGELGYRAEVDEWANVIVHIPARLSAGVDGRPEAPALALMCHLDTAEGTRAVSALEVAPHWDGSRIAYPDNDRLDVSLARYEATRFLVGDDVLFGPGDAPVGFDDKLGIAELMTMAKVLATQPEIEHGPLYLVFRPDEEIGRMEAVQGLASHLAELGVRYGYTVDGIEPFEVNVENFHASRAVVRAQAAPLRLPPAGAARRLVLAVEGAKSHGATAKAEGYLNATIVLARAIERLHGDGGDAGKDRVIPVLMETDPLAETSARVELLVRGADAAAVAAARDEVLGAFHAEVDPHAWRGARVRLLDERDEDPAAPVPGALRRIVEHLQAFLASEGPTPLLSEDSDGYQGYSNPYAVTPTEGGGAQVAYRLRDFDRAQLTAREEHVAAVARAASPPLDVEVTQQYVNMGPALEPYPELIRWAQEALGVVGEEGGRRPIRGGTGVDPFLEAGIPVGNLGTGYFAPESEKELTSRQNIARHTRWLTALVQVVA